MSRVRVCSFDGLLESAAHLREIGVAAADRYDFGNVWHKFKSLLWSAFTSLLIGGRTRAHVCRLCVSFGFDGCVSYPLLNV